MERKLDLLRIIFDNDQEKFENVISQMSHQEIKNQITTLNYALRNGNHKNYAKQLIEAGVPLNKPDQNGQLPIFTLIQNIHTYPSSRDYLNIVEKMINCHLNLNLCDQTDKTILMQACDLKIFPLIEILIKNGADINYQNKNGETAFFRAASFSSVDVMNQLKNFDADINCSNNHGQTPLMLSVNHRFNLKTLEWLIQNKADINAQDIQGNTALMYAIASNQIEATELLLKNGAKTEIQNKFSHTPLQLAKRIKNQNIIQLLQENRASRIKEVYQKYKQAHINERV